MRGLLLPIVIAILSICGLLAAVILVRRRQAASVVDAAAEVLATHGASRVILATRLIRRLTGSQALVEVWERIELPLLQALPDCPPDFKAELIAALDAAARSCARRDTASRLVTMRNSLIT